MIRMFAFFAILLAAAFGLNWLLDTPGSVLLSYGGYEYRVTLAKAVAIIIALTVGLLIVWSVIRIVLRLPSLISMTSRMRRKSRGYAAVSRGLVSIGVGDRRAASRFAGEAERLLGREPMTLLLKAQAAQLSGDRKAAESAFTRMLDDPETKVLGLRGLFIEARREGSQGARAFAEQAYRLAPASPWAGQAVLEYRTAEQDWNGAIAAVDEAASRRVIDRDTARRQKATLLAAQARQALERSPDAAFSLASQALKLNPGHVPATLIVAERLSAKGDYSKATRVLEQTWKLSQQPEIAEAYLGVRHGDSTHDRLKRARALSKITPKSREAGLALTKAAIDAREFDLARETLEPLVLQQPTARACRLMAEIEDKSSGNAGMVRKWLARASQAPRDPAWVADGFVSDSWAPVSPVSGRIDAFEWKTPPQSIETSVRASIDADHARDERPAPIELIESTAVAAEQTTVVDAARGGIAAKWSAAVDGASQRTVAVPSAVKEKPLAAVDAVAPPLPVKPDAPKEDTPATVAAAVTAPKTDRAEPAAASQPVREEASPVAALKLVDIVVPEPEAVAQAGVLARLPDDPGPRAPETPRKKRGLFG